ncbi:MAG: 16S rRNA (guanine(527)-N(7))-methyltransferase RsmG [Candidatus Korobacteraceae bacterium]|jgi:16S rRNA (guanine527-N7)-methyltransferase
MEASTLRDLLAPFIPAADLDDALLASVGVHLDLLTRWNQRINLTAIRSPEEMVVRHFGESLFAARALLSRGAQQEVIDLGSGAGFPGLPLKYWAPRLQLTLVESHGKKATFLREVGRALHLSGFAVLNVRAESLSQRASLVTLRAVEGFDRALITASHLVAPGGQLAILISETRRERALSLLPEGESTSLDLPSSEQRILLTWKPRA